MKSDTVLPLNPVNHYSRLPDGKSIQQFQQYLSAEAQKLSPPEKIESFKSSLVAAKNLNDAYLLACFCFGGLVFLQQLKQKGISQEVLAQMGKKMSQFSWAVNKNGFEIFEYNSKKIGSIYPFYYQKIFKVLDKNEKNCKQLFEWVKQKSTYLYGLKIRTWINKQSQKNYRQFQKQNQQGEVDRVNGNSYLIFAKTSTEAYNLGVIFEEIEFQSQRRDTSNNQLSDQVKHVNNVNSTNFQPSNIGSKSTSLGEVKLNIKEQSNKELEQPQNILRTPSGAFKIKSNSNNIDQSNPIKNNNGQTPSDTSKIKSSPKNIFQPNPINNNNGQAESSTLKVNLLHKQFQQRKQENKSWWKTYICCCFFRTS